MIITQDLQVHCMKTKTISWMISTMYLDCAEWLPHPLLIFNLLGLPDVILPWNTMLLRHLRLHHPGDHINNNNVIVLHPRRPAVVVLDELLPLDHLNEMLHEAEMLEVHDIAVETNGRILG